MKIWHKTTGFDIYFICLDVWKAFLLTLVHNETKPITQNASFIHLSTWSCDMEASANIKVKEKVFDLYQ